MRAIFAAVFMICTLGQALAASDADRSAIRGIIQDQIEAFKRDDAVRAFSYATPALQNMFGSQERFMDMVKDGYRPVYQAAQLCNGRIQGHARRHESERPDSRPGRRGLGGNLHIGATG